MQITIANLSPDEGLTVGVDVSKSHVDVAIWPGHLTERFKNDKTGLARLLDWLSDLKIALVVVEATGGLELPMLVELHDAGYQLARVNPRWIKDFARARGKRAKTDRLDAAMIALYGHLIRPEPWQPLPEDDQSFKDLCARRRQLITMTTMEMNRQKRCRNACLYRQHRQLIAHLKKQIDDIEAALEKLIEAKAERRQKYQIIRSVPGIGSATALTLLAEMPELGQLNAKQIAALAGLAPFNRDSGQLRGRRAIFGGRTHVRKVLYMVAVGITNRNNPHFKKHYEKLVQTGKPKKVAMVAIMRKLIVTLNAMLKTNTSWKSPASSFEAA